MNSSMKTGLLIGLVMLVIFAATVISQFTNGPKDSNSGDSDDAPTQPLRLATLNRKFDPDSEDPADWHFQAFHEPGQAIGEETLAKATFWFQNVHEYPVKVNVVGVSCGSCSHIAVRAIPASEMNECVNLTAAGLFPASPFPSPNILAAIGFAKLRPTDEGAVIKTSTAQAETIVPPAGPAGPTWGFLTLGVKINSTGQIPPRSADIGLQSEKMRSPAVVRLTTYLYGAAPFQLSPSTLNFGTFPEGASERKFAFTYWSSTRTALPPPVMNVDAYRDFVTLGKPVSMTGAERKQLATELSHGTGQYPVPVASGYIVPVTVRRKVADANPPEPDIGPFEANIGVVGPGTNAQHVRLMGTITGLVALGDGHSDVNLGDFNAEFGIKKEFKLQSSRTDLELEVVPGESFPGFLEVKLSPPTTEATRRLWSLTIRVPESTGFGPLPQNAVVVLRSKGSNPQRVRIPVKGNGFRR